MRKFLSCLLAALLLSGAALAATLPALTGGGAISSNDIFLTRQGTDTQDKKVTASQLSTYVLGRIPGNAITATDTDTAFSGTFGDVAVNAYAVTNLQPSSGSTAIKASLYGETNWNSSNSLTGTGHIIGTFGRVSNLGAGNVAWGIGSEGRCDATTGNFSLCSPFVATFGTDTASAGTIGIGIGFYIPDQPDSANITVPYAFLNEWTAAPVKSAGRFLNKADYELSPAPRAGFAASRYYFPQGITNQMNSAVTANLLYAGPPLLVGERTAFTKIGVAVTTQQTGCTIRLGIYKESGGVPGDLVADAGTVSCTTTGDKEAAISVTLDPGRYFLVAQPESASNPSLRLAIYDDSWLTYTYGATSSQPVPSSATVEDTMYVSHTGALPSTFGTATRLRVGAVPAVWLRK